MWFNNYIGIPFLADGNDREGCDCWGLAVLIYKEQLNIDLPVFAGMFVDGSLASLIRVTKHIRKIKKTWLKVNEPAPYDIILLRTGNMIYHVGVVIDKKQMLHVMEGINSTIEEFIGLQWKQKVEGFYRWKIEK